MPAVIRLAIPADADAIVAVFCGSKRPLMPWLEGHHEPVKLRSYVTDVLLQTDTVWVAVIATRIVGYAALQDGILEQLFVAAAFQGQGIGSQLLDVAKRAAGDRLSLYVFARNEAGRRFYERHGFAPSGVVDDEGEPDLSYEWRTSAPVPA